MTQTTTQPTLAVEIDITHIERNPKQPRQWFNNDELNNLAASIREHGIIQPLIVTRANANGIHTLIAGERRLIAAGRAERETVPAIIREVTCEQDYLILALVENVDRSEMTPVEEGDGYLALRAQGMSNAEIARKVGVTDARVGNCINCASLPEKTRALIHKGQLFISNQFISRLRDIAEISPKACDELAQQIADKQPALKVANKTATTLLNQLSALKQEKKPAKKKKNIFDAASKLSKLDIDESQPPSPSKWDVLKEAGLLPPWTMVTEAALMICAGCDLYGFASHPICSACTAARMVAQLAKKAEEQEAWATMSLLDTTLDSSLTTLITSSLKVAAAQTPSRKAPRWSEKDINRVRELLPYYSPKVVGQMLGRSEDAIKIMRQRQKIKASSKSKGWLSANRVMRLLGMSDARPVIGWVKKGLVLGHRIAGDDTWMVHEISLRRWIISPRSWVYFDTTRIQDPHLARLVELARERWDDEWLTTRQVADLKGTNTRQIGQSIFRGAIPAIHIVNKDGRHENVAWSFWAVKRSDAEAWQFKPPAFDLTDRMHAFILLAGAIGLSGVNIAKLTGISHSTASHRFQMMNNARHVKKMTKKYGLEGIEYRRKVGAHADWRKFAHRFPQVRSAFERYRDGKCTTDDCYLIIRILKNQMVANGMKANVNALGKVSHGTVDDLVARMRKAEIKPYLLPKPRKQ